MQVNEYVWKYTKTFSLLSQMSVMCEGVLFSHLAGLISTVAGLISIGDALQGGLQCIALCGEDGGMGGGCYVWSHSQPNDSPTEINWMWLTEWYKSFICQPVCLLFMRAFRVFVLDCSNCITLSVGIMNSLISAWYHLEMNCREVFFWNCWMNYCEVVNMTSDVSTCTVCSPSVVAA